VEQVSRSLHARLPPSLLVQYTQVVHKYLMEGKSSQMFTGFHVSYSLLFSYIWQVRIYSAGAVTYLTGSAGEMVCVSDTVWRRK
jgi:hypothetical protein